MCRKLEACWKIAFWSCFWVGDSVGRSCNRRAAELYWVKESVSRLRTRVASASCAGLGGLSGSLKRNLATLADYARDELTVKQREGAETLVASI